MPVLTWLRDDKNREIVKMAAAGLAAVAAAGWAVFTFVGSHHDATPTVSAGAGGIAAGRDVSGATITLAPPPAVPPAPSAKP